MAANFGLSKCDADVVTLLNSDTIVAPGWDTRLRSHFMRFPALGIVGPISNAASYQSVPGIVGSIGQTAVNELPTGVGPDDVAGFCSKIASVEDMPFVPLVHGFCFTISKACLQAVGVFDEKSFPRGYGEETDYCMRAQDAGFALGVALDVFVFHAKSKSYTSSDRVRLMESGWNILVQLYGKRRLQRAIEVMEGQPALKRMRSEVHKRFYDKANAPIELLKVMPVGELSSRSGQVGALAFYLPQFHPTPENDKNWGRGFTEWTNVTRAMPRFEGHYQPRLPGELGFYDLRVPEVMRQQAELAAAHGVTGFCFYYYRFGAKRTLDVPLRLYRSNDRARLPYCYCWANESWTRAWDGKTADVLFEQTYDDETFDGLVADLVDAIDDERYIRIHGRPVFLIYQASELPGIDLFAARLRAEVRDRTSKDLLLGTVYSPGFRPEVMTIVDFAVQFPPHRMPRSWARVTVPASKIRPFSPEREDYYEAYDTVVDGALQSSELLDRMFPGVCPDWDNAARRQRNATTLVGSTPEKFRNWVEKAARVSAHKHATDQLPLPLIFVNAWNEWAEGAVLEPSERHGRAYLEALRDGLAAVS